jgi:hypothetical protein
VHLTGCGVASMAAEFKYCASEKKRQYVTSCTMILMGFLSQLGRQMQKGNRNLG